MLITRRRSDQTSPGKWEFPGGKIEPGESPERALARELVEEIGARSDVGTIWDVLFHAYPRADVYLLVYRCRLAPGEVPTARTVADAVWARPADLPGYDLLEADAPLVRRLAREGAPPFAGPGEGE